MVVNGYIIKPGANLRGANLWRADLRDANLRDSNLLDSNLRGADLRGADLPNFQICPQEGPFIAYKKVNTGVIKVEIPAGARRTSSLVGRKCRAEYVIAYGSGMSRRGGRYQTGEVYRPDEYDDDIRVECTHGVHFFMTREEAEQW